MLQTHYYLIQKHSDTKRASSNLSLGLSFQPLSLVPAAVHLWLHSQQQSFIFVHVSSQPREWLALAILPCKHHCCSSSEENCRWHLSTAAAIYIILSLPYFPIALQIVVRWTLKLRHTYFLILQMNLLKKQEINDEIKQHTDTGQNRQHLMMKWPKRDFWSIS